MPKVNGNNNENQKMPFGKITVRMSLSSGIENELIS